MIQYLAHVASSHKTKRDQVSHSSDLDLCQFIFNLHPTHHFHLHLQIREIPNSSCDVSYRRLSISLSISLSQSSFSLLFSLILSIISLILSVISLFLSVASLSHSLYHLYLFLSGSVIMALCYSVLTEVVQRSYSNFTQPVHEKS